MSKLFTILSATVFAVDRVLKYYVQNLPSEEVFLFGDVFEFDYFLNPALFFFPVWGFISWFALIMLIGVFGFWIWSFIENRKLKIKNSRHQAILLILLGGISNVFDRFVYGGVIDYARIAGFITVNLADTLIIAGLIVLLKKTRHLNNPIDQSTN